MIGKKAARFSNVWKTPIVVARLAILAAGQPLAAAGATHYVWTNSPANGPGTAWSNAFHDIQSAVDVATTNDLVLVTNGVYETGGRVTPGAALTNRIVVTNAITVRSVNGPTATVIVGQGPLGVSAVRCAYLANGAVLSGFTLTNGYTFGAGMEIRERGGGGVWLDQGGTISDCVLTANGAWFSGGGAYCNGGGILRDCIVNGNQAVWGGGVYFYTNGTMRTCSLAGNSASNAAGGVYVLYAGAFSVNSILYFNTAGVSNPNWCTNGGGQFQYSCTTPDPGGLGNITNDPQFVGGGDCHLQEGSACIDAGTNLPGMLSDRDGVPRPLDGDTNGAAVVDMGCHEFIHPLADTDGDTMRDPWEIAHDLNPTDAADADEDDDEDEDDNKSEHTADTDPQNSNSYFRLTGVERTNSMAVWFVCTNSRVYSLGYTTNLVNSEWWMAMGETNKPGEADGRMSLTDTNDDAFKAYRVGVEEP